MAVQGELVTERTFMFIFLTVVAALLAIAHND